MIALSSFEVNRSTFIFSAFWINASPAACWMIKIPNATNGLQCN